MKAGGGKSKGGSFEREMSRELSLWISNGKDNNLLWRSATSGGAATIRRKKGITTGLASAHLGDMCAVGDNPLGHKFVRTFHAEMKFYKDLKFSSLMRFEKKNKFGNRRKKEPGVFDVWDVMRVTSSRVPLMILKQNFCQVLLVLPVLIGEKITTLLPIMIFPGKNMYIFLMNDFLRCYSFERICETIKPKQVRSPLPTTIQLSNHL